MIRVLNIGSGRCKSVLKDAEEMRLDCDPDVKPDILGDICDPNIVIKDSYDCVWCSHVLEHLYEHQISYVLDKIHSVLNSDGVLILSVPDIASVVKQMVSKNLELSDVLYQSQIGPIRVLDVFYGLQSEIKKGKVAYTHKMGFDYKSIKKVLMDKFAEVYIRRVNYEICTVSCVTKLPLWANQFMKGL